MKLLLTGAFSYSDDMLSRLEGLGYEIVFHQDEREKIPFDVSDIQAVVCNGLFLYNDIERFVSLKFIQTTSAGLDRIPLDYVKKSGIKLCNARGVYSIPMAEFALAGTLCLYKKMNSFYEKQKKHIWQKDHSLEELSEKQVLIVGNGSVGNECAKRYSAFTDNIAGVDLIRPECELYKSFYTYDELDKALPSADIVVLTLPLTEQTRALFGKEKFKIMKKNAVLVNLARGAVAVEEDLIEFLKNGRLGGAVLDVFTEEPLDRESPLWELDNVIITPHNCFYSPANNQRLFNVIVKNLSDFIKG